VLGLVLSTHWRPRITALPVILVVTGFSIAAARSGVVPVTTANWILGGVLGGLLAGAGVLRHLRLTLIVAVAIPLAVFITFGLMFFQHRFFQELTLNIMTLGGLAMGIGMLVDNSIVVLDNILKHRARGESPRPGAVSGASQMLLAISASTLTTVVVLLPIVFINKEIRILYTGFALTISYSLIASLFVALMVVPLLASRLLFPVTVAAPRPSRFRAGYRGFSSAAFGIGGRSF
jgi:multidrug efflux pump subunit AcrB